MDDSGPYQTPARMTRPALVNVRFGTPQHVDVLTALEPAVRKEMEAHVARRRLWFPNDLMPADAESGPEREAELDRTREAARDLPDVVRIALALNLLTEEGLPHFHRLIAVYFGPASPWSDWNHLWTAEEDRHGCVMRDYVRDARIFDMRAVEQMQFHYIEASGKLYDPTVPDDGASAGDGIGHSEFAGPRFSPDGKWLFVNIQVPGITCAITGPWEDLGL